MPCQQVTSKNLVLPELHVALYGIMEILSQILNSNDEDLGNMVFYHSALPTQSSSDMAIFMIRIRI